MDYRRYLLEVGTGIDLHGMDETKAAQRAVKDAISHSSMVGVLPEGRRRITVVKGGLEFPAEDTVEEARTHGVVMVNACIVVLVDVDKVERR
jgi:hypothetical protein